MPEIEYCGRRAHRIENDLLQVTVSIEGGHIAEILHKPTSVNPLWTPPWPSIEPSQYNPEIHGSTYGTDAESKLLAGILGHNLCLDLFGPPSPEEAAAGITVHGEASVVPYVTESSDGVLKQRCILPIAQLAFERRIQLKNGDPNLYISETVENLSALDRPIAWTQHVTLGPPFLEKGKTQFRVGGTKSRTLEGQDFDWPYLPHPDGPREDLQLFTNADASGKCTSTLMDPHREQAYFLAWSPTSKVLIGYQWRRTDFPWISIWEENHSRHNPPWNGRALTRGMEFGASPVPESRRKMIERNTLFGAPGYRWVPAKSKVSVDYKAFMRVADGI